MALVDISTEDRYIQYIEARCAALQAKLDQAEADCGYWQGVASYWKAIAEARRFDSREEDPLSTELPTLEERQHKTHHELRMLLTNAFDEAQLDIAEDFVAKARAQGLLIRRDIDDLAAYGFARRAGMGKRKAK